jgi:hypothetical protein
MLACAQEDAELLTLHMSSEGTVHAAALPSGTFRTGASGGPSQQHEGIAGPLNQQREGTPSRSSLSCAPFPDREMGALSSETGKFASLYAMFRPSYVKSFFAFIEESLHPYTPSCRSMPGPSSRAEMSGRSS